MAKSNLAYFVERYECTPSDASDDIKKTEWERLQTLQKDKGFKPGFPYMAYKETFGEAPPAEWTK